MFAIKLGLISLLGMSSAFASAAPSRLYNKTIHVSWRVDSVERYASDQSFSRTTTRPRHLIIYISTLGRPFMRRWNAEGGGRGEQVGESGKNGQGGPRVIEFQGQSLVWTSVKSDNATRVQIDFDANFGSCTASVISGKQAGAGTYYAARRHAEVQSASARDASCMIEEGNGFVQ